MSLLKKSIIILFQMFLLLWGSMYALITILIPLNFLTISGWSIILLIDIFRLREKTIVLFGKAIKIQMIGRILLIIICTITNLWYWDVTKQVFYNFGHPR